MPRYCASFQLPMMILLLAILCGCLSCPTAYAEDRELSLELSWGNESSINADLTARQLLPSFYSGEIVEIRPLVEASGIYWHNDDDSIFGGGVSAGLQINFWQYGSVSPFIAGSFGGFLLSDNDFGKRDLGTCFQFRSKGSLGVHFGDMFRHSLQVTIAHFSNAGLSSHNAEFNTYGLAYGFRF